MRRNGDSSRRLYKAQNSRRVFNSGLGLQAGTGIEPAGASGMGCYREIVRVESASDGEGMSIGQNRRAAPIPDSSIAAGQNTLAAFHEDAGMGW